MTSEVVVMNRDAVALAADSAATLSIGKVLNSANKLFMLAPGYAIGVLIFGNSRLMGISWELIIKLYRDRLLRESIRFSRLPDYTADFIDFIKQQSEILFPQGEQKGFVSFMIDHLMEAQIVNHVGERSNELIIEQGRKILGQEIINITEQRINDLCTEWESAPDLFDEEATQQILTSLEEDYFSLFDENYSHYLGALNLEDGTKQRLWRLCAHWFTKQQWMPGIFSGIVFAGYGDDDLFPSLTEYRCESYVCGSLKHYRTMTQSGEQHVGVYSFAQDDIIQTLISGMHPQAWENLSEILVGAQPKEESRQQFNTLREKLEDAMFERYTMSTINMVGSLSKDELALMAETLVNITSFMRRVSVDAETVGGPTDVAVISKKDGFIWIKRKHYFDAQYNYHFFTGGQHSGRGRDGNTDG